MRDVKIIYGNWKMNHGTLEMESFLSDLSPEFKDLKCIKGIAPQFPLISPMQKQGLAHHICAGAQNCSTDIQGAMTGEVSAKVLSDMRVNFVLVGHSERREIFCETNQIINQKLKNVLSHGLQAVLCIGESLTERENNQTFDVIKKQLHECLHNSKEILDNHHEASLVIAYEPIWAIGTGKVASKEQAQEVHSFIRQEIIKIDLKGEETSIIYGGSVKPENAQELLSQPDIDGALIGGASLDVQSFMSICRTAAYL